MFDEWASKNNKYMCTVLSIIDELADGTLVLLLQPIAFRRLITDPVTHTIHSNKQLATYLVQDASKVGITPDNLGFVMSDGAVSGVRSLVMGENHQADTPSHDVSPSRKTHPVFATI